MKPLRGRVSLESDTKVQHCFISLFKSFQNGFKSNQPVNFKVLNDTSQWKSKPLNKRSQNASSISVKRENDNLGKKHFFVCFSFYISRYFLFLCMPPLWKKLLPAHLLKIFFIASSRFWLSK